MTIWMDKEPGCAPSAEDLDGSVITLVAGRPDWVRLPANLGGQQARVLEVERSRCPVRGHAHDCSHYHLAGGISVAECDQFYWYRTSTTEDAP